MIYFKLIEITVIVVIIIDISGFVDSIKSLVGKVLGINNVKLKPFDCSFCLNFWVSMGYLIWVVELSLTTLMFSLLCSTLTPVVSDLIYVIRDLIANLINKISNLIN